MDQSGFIGIRRFSLSSSGPAGKLIAR